MLEAMRRNMKVVLWITIIFFVLLIFLVWGADLQFGNAPPPNVIGNINGQQISVGDYQQVLAISRQNAQARGQELQPTDELILQEQAWDAVINDLLVRQEAKRRGIVVRDSEIRSVLLNNPPAIITQDPNFQNDQGQFDLATYRALIQDPATPESFLIQLEAYVRDSLPSQKLQELVVSGAKVTDDEIRQLYADQNEKCSISYILFDGRQASVVSEVTDEDLERYYEAHPEKSRRAERVNLTYINVPRIATPADSATIRADLVQFAEDARTHLRNQQAGEENLELSDFETLALTFSDSPSADNGGLSVGYLSAAELSPAFSAALENLSVGEISEPFLDAPYYRILKLEDEELDNDNQRRVLIRDLAITIAPSDSTIMAIRDDLEAVRALAQTVGLAQAAEQHGYTVREANDVLSGGVAPGLSALPQASAFAHDNPQGTVSRILPANTGWYLLEVGEHKPAGVAPLEEVKDQLRVDLLRSRRYEVAKAEADQISGRIKLGESMEQVAEAESLTVAATPEFSRISGIRGFTQDHDLLGKAFSSPVASVSEPIETSRGWVILRVDTHPELDWTNFDAQQPALRRARLSFKQTQVLNAFLEKLRREATIDDYRI